MGTVTITFSGVCTHFLTQDTVLHQTMMVNGSGNNVIGGIVIPPHCASMTFSPTVDFPENQTLSLMGQNVGVVNGVGRLIYEESFLKVIPGLDQQMENIEPLGPRVDNPQWPLVASVFTTTSGKFTGCLAGPAANATLVIETSDPNVKLSLSPLPGNPPGAISGEFELLSPASISISNKSLDPSDPSSARAHFLLHYLLAQQFPSVPQIPLQLFGPQCPNLGTDSVGCSDANYP